MCKPKPFFYILTFLFLCYFFFLILFAQMRSHTHLIKGGIQVKINRNFLIKLLHQHQYGKRNVMYEKLDDNMPGKITNLDTMLKKRLFTGESNNEHKSQNSQERENESEDSDKVVVIDNSQKQLEDNGDGHMVIRDQKLFKELKEALKANTGRIDWKHRLKFNGHYMEPFSPWEDNYLAKCTGEEHYEEDLTALFKKWDEFARRENIHYFLTAGSLLGAFLQGKPIDCDSDVDVLIDYRDMSKLTTLQNERDFTDDKNDNVSRLILQKDWMTENDDERRRFNCEGKQVESLKDGCSFQEPMGRFILNTFYVDIFSYKSKQEKITKLINDKTLHKQDIFPTKQCYLLGVQSNCPKNTEKFLRVHYGHSLVNFFIGHFEKFRKIENAFSKLK